MELETAGTAFALLGIATMGGGLIWAIISAYRAGKPSFATGQAIRFTGAGAGTLIAAFSLLILAIPPSILDWPVTGFLALPVGLLGSGVILWSPRARVIDESAPKRRD